ncbi:unnamed protein product [Heterobilharzia americana]|nr:unnamed protein product [Heterobilharzia americana]
MARMMGISSKELTLVVDEPTKREAISEQVCTGRKWICVVHGQRRSPGDIRCQAMRGCGVEPRWGAAIWASESLVTCIRWCEEEMRDSEVLWSHVLKSVEKRVEWRRVVESLCSTRNPMNK